MRMIAAKRGGATTAFPLTLANLGPWYDLAQQVGVADAGIASLTDFSGGGHHAVQATGGKQPTYKTGIQNGLPVARFDGTADAVVAPARTWGTAMTAVVVVRGYVAGGSYQILYEVGDQGAGNGANCYFDPGSVNAIAALIATGGPSAWDLGVRAAPQCLAVTYDATQTGANEVRGFAGGVAVGSSYGTANNTGSLGSLALNLGARGGTALYGGFDLCEAAFYDRVLTAPEIADWWTYADAKWGL